MMRPYVQKFTGQKNGSWPVEVSAEPLFRRVPLLAEAGILLAVMMRVRCAPRLSIGREQGAAPGDCVGETNGWARQRPVEESSAIA